MISSALLVRVFSLRLAGGIMQSGGGRSGGTGHYNQPCNPSGRASLD